MSRVRQTYGFVGFQLEGVPVGDKPFDAVDVDRAVECVAAAIRFAGMGADTSANGRQRIAVFNNGERFGKVAAMDVVNIFLDIDMRRATQNAGCHAITVMIAQQRLEINFAITHERVRLGPDDHAVGNRCGCCGSKPGFSAVGYLYKCGFEITRGTDARVVAQRGNVDAMRTGHVDDRQTADRYTVVSINIYSNHENMSFHFLVLSYPKLYRLYGSLNLIKET